MKRFLLFSYDYYPEGGWRDFYDSFDTLEDAHEASQTLTLNLWHIVDSKTWKIVEPFKQQTKQ